MKHFLFALIVVWLLASCSSLTYNQVCFVHIYGHGGYLIKNNLSSYEKYTGDSNIISKNIVFKNKIQICSDKSTICIDGPFFIKVDKSTLVNIFKYSDNFNIKYSHRGNLYIVNVSKDEGVTGFTIFMDADLNEENEAVPLIYKKCPLEFGKLSLDGLINQVRNPEQ